MDNVKTEEQRMESAELRGPSTIYVPEGTGKTVNDGGKAKEVANAELFAAIQESVLPRWSKQSLKLYFYIFIAFLCSCANGYDGSLMSSILAMKPFQETFGSGLVGQRTSLLSSLYSVGSIVAFPIAPLVSDRFGRRLAMLCGAASIIVGSIVAATSFSVAQFLVGRFILGGGIMFMTVSAPAYAIEISPPHWRGRATGFYNCGWFGGSIPASLVTFGCQYITDDWSWKIPVILQCFAAAIVLFVVLFIPESPRFLMARDKEEEAIDFLVKYHGNGNRDSRLVMLEVEEIRENIRVDMIERKKPWWDYRPLFNSSNSRWRVSQVIMIGVFGQFSGNGLGYYNSTIFKMMGSNTTAAQLGWTVLNQILSAIGALTAMSQTDRMPRRKVLVWGTFATAVMLAINGALTTAFGQNLQNLGYAKGALAFYFIFNVVYSFTYTPLQGVVPAEALDTTLRAKGLALYGFVVNIFGFINAYAGPIALQRIQYNYIWIFVGWDCIETVLWYLFGVESQGRSLEELAWVYDQRNPVAASKMVDKVVVQADGTVSEKIVDQIN